MSQILMIRRLIASACQLSRDASDRRLFDLQSLIGEVWQSSEINYKQIFLLDSSNRDFVDNFRAPSDLEKKRAGHRWRQRVNLEDGVVATCERCARKN